VYARAENEMCQKRWIENAELEQQGRILRDWENVKTKRYNTIRDAILTCARKPTWVRLIYRTDMQTGKLQKRSIAERVVTCEAIMWGEFHIQEEQGNHSYQTPPPVRCCLWWVTEYALRRPVRAAPSVESLGVYAFSRRLYIPDNYVQTWRHP